MNLAASHLPTGRALRGTVQCGRFLEEEGWVKGLSTKQRKGLFLNQDTFPGEENGKDFYHAGCHVLWGIERVRRTHYRIAVDQRSPGGVNKIIFLGETERESWSSIKPGSDITDFSTSDTTWACSLLFN